MEQLLEIAEEDTESNSKRYRHAFIPVSNARRNSDWLGLLFHRGIARTGNSPADLKDDVEYSALCHGRNGAVGVLVPRERSLWSRFQRRKRSSF